MSNPDNCNVNLALTWKSRISHRPYSIVSTSVRTKYVKLRPVGETVPDSLCALQPHVMMSKTTKRFALILILGATAKFLVLICC
jgi:hypothetical protein